MPEAMRVFLYRMGLSKGGEPSSDWLKGYYRKKPGGEVALDHLIIEQKLEQSLVKAKARVAAGRKMVAPGRFGQWKWGEYGWISPVNLFLAASAVKLACPAQDVCRIWSRDGDGKKIPHSYSIRTIDERVVVPFVAKHNIASNFCSANSGMQGSRAIEKSRGATRIPRDWSGDQKTSFDLALFSNLMNDINNSSPEEVEEILVYLLEVAESRLRAREKSKLRLSESLGVGGTRSLVLAAVSEIKDPEFVKCVAAALMKHIFGARFGMVVDGVESAKTAADARDGKVGDFWLQSEQGSMMACEVKDSSRALDWQAIRTASDRLLSHQGLDSYVFITARRQPFADGVCRSLNTSGLADIEGQDKISFLSVFDLLPLVPECTATELIDEISEMLQRATSLKSDTLTKWMRHRDTGSAIK